MIAPSMRPPLPRSVLVVEDDEALGDEVVETLRDAGYAAERKADGRDALLRLAQDPLPHLILLDLHLPRMDGWEFRVRQRASKRCADIPVIVASGDSSPHAAAIDVDYVLRKPFTQQDLIQTVSNAFAALERERSRAERLAHVDRLASLGTMAAGVGHELNNPLTFVIGSIDSVEQQLRELEKEVTEGRLVELSSRVRDLRAGADRMARIVRSLRVFGHGVDQQPIPLDLRPLLETAVTIAFSEIRHRARLVKDYGDLPLVEGDETRLTQVFVNLLVNAAQAIPLGAPDRHEIRIHTLTDAAGQAVVEVRDDGSGIPDEIQARVFDPFFTTKPVGTGTGLGLFICHGIVEGHNGSIGFETDAGCGTVFRVTLPPTFVQKTAAAPRQRVRPAGEKRARILVVDDEPLIAAVLLRILAQDHDVTTVESGREALARIVAGERFQLILCDLSMPEITGMELYGELVRLFPDQAARMVFMTGGAFTPDVKLFFQNTQNPCIQKPFEQVTLRSLISTLLR